MSVVMGRSGKYLVKIVLFEAIFHFPHSFYGFITSKLKRLYGMYSILIMFYVLLNLRYGATGYPEEYLEASQSAYEKR